MEIARTEPIYRYPGISSFEVDHHDLFFGRMVESKELYLLIKAQKITVLFSKSGLGKSSLLSAGTGPILKEHGFLPIKIRFGYSAKQNSVLDLKQTIVTEVEKYFEKNGLDKTFLQRYKYRIDLPSSEQTISVAEQTSPSVTMRQLVKDILQQENKIPVLMFDQFEELFSYSPTAYNSLVEEVAELIHDQLPVQILDQLALTRKEIESKYSGRIAELYNKYTSVEEKMSYEDELALGGIYEAIDKEVDLAIGNDSNQPGVRIVIAIRSDRIYELQKLVPYIPSILRNRYELKPLNTDEARKAIVEPAALQGNYITLPFRYSEDAISKIIAKLYSGTEGTNTVFLQLLCSKIERDAEASQKEGKVLYTVSGSDLDDRLSVEKIVDDFYEQQMQCFNTSERLLVKRILEKNLVVNDHRTSLIHHQMLALTGGNEELIQKILDSKLVRTEGTHLGLCYELSHDILVSAVAKRKQEKDITNQLLEIDSFYKKQLEKLSPEEYKMAEKILEEELVVNGRRTSLTEDQMLSSCGNNQELIDKLIQLRLIKQEENNLGVSYILIHDRLVKPITESYEKRKLEESYQKELEAKEREALALKKKQEESRREFENHIAQQKKEIEQQRKMARIVSWSVSMGVLFVVIVVAVFFWSAITVRSMVVENCRTKAVVGCRNGDHYHAFWYWHYAGEVERIIANDTLFLDVPLMSIGLNGNKMEGLFNNKTSILTFPLPGEAEVWRILGQKCERIWQSKIISDEIPRANNKIMFATYSESEDQFFFYDTAGLPLDNYKVPHRVTDGNDENMTLKNGKKKKTITSIKRTVAAVNGLDSVVRIDADSVFYLNPFTHQRLSGLPLLGNDFFAFNKKYLIKFKDESKDKQSIILAGILNDTLVEIKKIGTSFKPDKNFLWKESVMSVNDSTFIFNYSNVCYLISQFGNNATAKKMEFTRIENCKVLCDSLICYSMGNYDCVYNVKKQSRVFNSEPYNSLNPLQVEKSVLANASSFMALIADSKITIYDLDSKIKPEYIFTHDVEDVTFSNNDKWIIWQTLTYNDSLEQYTDSIHLYNRDRKTLKKIKCNSSFISKQFCVIQSEGGNYIYNFEADSLEALTGIPQDFRGIRIYENYLLVRKTNSTGLVRIDNIPRNSDYYKKAYPALTNKEIEQNFLMPFHVLLYESLKKKIHSWFS